MPRIRSLRPEFWDDELLAKSTSRDARMLYEGTWTFADEHGRLRGSGEYLKGKVFPYDADLDAEAIECLVDELVAAGKVVRYVVNGETYLHVPNLGKHNRLEPDKSASKLPPPPDPNEPPLFGINELSTSVGRADSPGGSALYRGGGGGSRDKGGGGARAEPRDAEPEPPPPRTCAKHPDGTDSPCRGCQRARERRQAYDAEAKAEQARVAERQRTAPRCVEHPSEPAHRCRLCAAERKGRDP